MYKVGDRVIVINSEYDDVCPGIGTIVTACPSGAFGVKLDDARISIVGEYGEWNFYPREIRPFIAKELWIFFRNTHV